MPNYYTDSQIESYYRNRYEREYGYDPLEGPYEDEEGYDDEWEESDEVISGNRRVSSRKSAVMNATTGSMASVRKPGAGTHSAGDGRLKKD